MRHVSEAIGLLPLVAVVADVQGQVPRFSRNELASQEHAEMSEFLGSVSLLFFRGGVCVSCGQTQEHASSQAPFGEA
jgi:hypothetical protein